MSFISDFKSFAMRGNVVDMAVGVIIGGAFGKIVSSLVSDIVMPPIGILLGGVDFSDLAVTLKHATADAAAVTINYGMFLQTVIDFLIIALAIFSVIRVMNRLHRQKPQAPAAPSQEQLLTEIRDLLKAKR
jgi:large conductance mechanosensitive channel